MQRVRAPPAVEAEGADTLSSALMSKSRTFSSACSVPLMMRGPPDGAGEHAKTGGQTCSLPLHPPHHPARSWASCNSAGACRVRAVAVAVGEAEGVGVPAPRNESSIVSFRMS